MLKKISINFFLVFFSLLFVEFFFSIFFLLRPNPTISIIFKPFVSYDEVKMLSRIEKFDYEKNKYKPGKYKTEKIEYQINQDGFRGPELTKEQKESCIGITYGGSTTIGLESKYKDTYPKILEDELNFHGKNCRVLNAGVSSKSLKYIFSRSLNELSTYKPKFITIYNNRNSAMYDATTSELKTDIVNTKLNLSLFKIRFYLENNIMTYKFLKKIFLRMTEADFGTPHPTDPTRSINMKYFEEEYLNLLEQINSFSKINNTRLILIKQIYYINPPIQKKLEQNTLEENLLKLKNYHNFDIEKNTTKKLSELEKFNNYFMLTNTILNQQLDKIKDKHKDILVVDILDEFYTYDSKTMTYDGYHLKKEGNKKIARGILEVLKNEVLKNIN